MASYLDLVYSTSLLRFEKRYGQMANGSLCVTRTLQHELAQNWGIRLNRYLCHPLGVRDCVTAAPDEDFGILLEAAVMYDRRAAALLDENDSADEGVLWKEISGGKQYLYPRLFFIITGSADFVGRSSPFVSIYHATVLYDQPPEFFCPTSLQEKHKVTTGIGAADQNETLFTTLVDTDILLKPNRPALVVSSTSWTPDEDFGILLEAAVMYDRRVAALLDENDSADEGVLWKEISGGKQYLYPRLLFIITGKGPEKEKYEEKIKRLNLKRVAFRTMWLSAEEYPLLLGSADLGVCLHTSSSGLDLPMKVVDMFGCGLPVCAVSYSCIDELVKVEKNGLLFSSSSELADELFVEPLSVLWYWLDYWFTMLFRGFPKECDALKSLKNGALETGSSARWATEWEEHAKPLISEVI
ncbi:hypothetical protein GOBAR_DD03757 [Gossypium barbadense]|nr:hypothetical protein GOBAR_DD03757 [Gossypium barbadense]